MNIKYSLHNLKTDSDIVNVKNKHEENSKLYSATCVVCIRYLKFSSLRQMMVQNFFQSQNAT